MTSSGADRLGEALARAVKGREAEGELPEYVEKGYIAYHEMVEKGFTRIAMGLSRDRIQEKLDHIPEENGHSQIIIVYNASRKFGDIYVPRESHERAQEATD